jgi:hypothetical protein
MKKSVYTYKTIGRKFSIDLEIFMELNRELTEKDEDNLRRHVEKIVKSIQEESMNLDPEYAEQAKTEKSEILSLFDNRVIFVEEIPNGYCSDYCCKHLPWFIVTTNKGRIKIGWRKRVIHIDWTDSIIKETSETLFPNEDVTKFDTTIHAWGLEKAKEYINLLLS